jgi:hypothetical protein
MKSYVVHGDVVGFELRDDPKVVGVSLTSDSRTHPVKPLGRTGCRARVLHTGSRDGARLAGQVASGLLK